MQTVFRYTFYQSLIVNQRSLISQINYEINIYYLTIQTLQRGFVFLQSFNQAFFLLLKICILSILRILITLFQFQLADSMRMAHSLVNTERYNDSNVYNNNNSNNSSNNKGHDQTECHPIMLISRQNPPQVELTYKMRD